jgi:hypothetical protein
LTPSPISSNPCVMVLTLLSNMAFSTPSVKRATVAGTTPASVRAAIAHRSCHPTVELHCEDVESWFRTERLPYLLSVVGRFRPLPCIASPEPELLLFCFRTRPAASESQARRFPARLLWRSTLQLRERAPVPSRRGHVDSITRSTNNAGQAKILLRLSAPGR